MTFEHYAEIALIEHSRLQRLAFNRHGETTMREVSKDEFYERMNTLDVHPRIANDRWPYTSMWDLHHQSGRPCVGKSIGQTDGSHVYFLTNAS